MLEGSNLEGVTLTTVVILDIYRTVHVVADGVPGRSIWRDGLKRPILVKVTMLTRIGTARR